MEDKFNEYTFLDRRYIAKIGDKGIRHLEVIPASIPNDSLSKYYQLTENSVFAFLNNSFFASQPDQFNDLFDTSETTINFDHLDFDEILMQGIIEIDEISHFKSEYDKDRDKFVRMFNTMMYYNWIRQYGILCLTPNKTNDLMWAHYTDNTGFLIEFFTHELPKDNQIGIYKINYPKEKFKINLRNTNCHLAIFIESLNKKAIWSYEEEYRIFYVPSNDGGFKLTGKWGEYFNSKDSDSRLITYNNKAIKSVYLGFHFLRDEELSIISKSKTKIKFHDPKKICIFNKLFDDKIKVFLVVMDPNLYQFKEKELIIRKVDHHIFEIEQILA